ncbi:hypothetical protein [uncultured Thiothrix sp.]|jgi:hypothetical protein|nr:hypothetical protein [uncultured Thiothrix sp.]HMT95030.1 hypothetical protein [Thiolinea sp.]
MNLKLLLSITAFAVVVYLLTTATNISVNAEVSKESNRFGIELQR